MALGIAALAVSHSKNTYLDVKYKGIMSRRGKMKAIVAIERTILTAACHLLTEGVCYDDPGADYYLRKNPDRQKRNAINRLHTLEHTVALTPPTNTPEPYYPIRHTE